MRARNLADFYLRKKALNVFFAAELGARRHHGGGRGGDGYAKISVFGVQGEGNKFVYLFDRSSSMGYGDRWTRALAAARSLSGSASTRISATP